MNKLSASSTPEPAKSTITTTHHHRPHYQNQQHPPQLPLDLHLAPTLDFPTRFKIRLRKVIPDKEDDKQSTVDNNNNDKDKENDNNTNNVSKPQEFKQVDLVPVEQTTGEEDEISHFNCTAKIFELNLSKSAKVGKRECGTIASRSIESR